MEHEVGDVDDIVDWSETYRKELFLKPLRRWSDLYSLDGSTGISR